MRIAHGKAFIVSSHPLAIFESFGMARSISALKRVRRTAFATRATTLKGKRFVQGILPSVCPKKMTGFGTCQRGCDPYTVAVVPDDAVEVIARPFSRTDAKPSLACQAHAYLVGNFEPCERLRWPGTDEPMDRDDGPVQVR